MDPLLRARMRIEVDGFRLDVDLSVAPGELAVLLGPNGAGKTTSLRAIAGLRCVDEGRIEIDGCFVDDASRCIPPEQRPVAYVPRGGGLFPHMTALENVAFGPRRAGVRRSEAARRARALLSRFDCEDLSERKPGSLSAGQTTRVALARALAVEPKLLLLDEPFASLDVTARAAARRAMRGYLSAFDGSQIVVTHDPLDALVTADRIIVMEDGRVTQSDAPEVIKKRPRSKFVAEFVGLNLFRGTSTDGVIMTEEGARVITANREPSGAVIAVVHPRSVALHASQPEASPRNCWRATVTDVDDEKDRLRVHLDGEIAIVAEVTPGAVSQLDIRRGAQFFAVVKATDIAVEPA